MSQKSNDIKISDNDLSNIIDHLVYCKFGGKCSDEVKSFSNELALPLHTYNNMLMDKQKKKSNVLPNKSTGSFSLYDGKYQQNK